VNDKMIQREVTREQAERLLEVNTWVDISFCGPWPGAEIWRDPGEVKLGR
jgi:hypothetical protein